MATNVKVFAWLGDTPFERLNYPSSLSEKSSAEFAEHELIGTKPTLQATGLGLIEMKWAATLNGLLCDVSEELEKLKKLMNEQKALPLTYFDGTNPGDFVITDLDIKKRQIVNNKITLADINFTLLEYIEIRPLAQKTLQAVEKAPAVTRSSSNSKPKPVTTQTTPQKQNSQSMELKRVGNTPFFTPVPKPEADARNKPLRKPTSIGIK